MITKEKKQSLIEEFRKNEADTGSAEVQIAIMTERINELTTHMRQNKHDYAAERGLMMLVGQRRRLLRYLSKTDPATFRTLTKKLKIRVQQ